MAQFTKTVLILDGQAEANVVARFFVVAPVGAKLALTPAIKRGGLGTQNE